MSPSQEQTREALLTLWAAVCNWQDDRACNLLPTEGSLQRARDVAEKALARNGWPILHAPISEEDAWISEEDG